MVQILFEEFDEARSLSTQEWKKKGRILKIILYGSYARGGWVDEPHIAKGYQSDFDLLIIVNDKRLTDRVEYWAKAEERLNLELVDHQGSQDPGQLHRPHASRGERWSRPWPLLLHRCREGRDRALPERRQRACRAQAQDARPGAGDGEGIFRGVVSERRRCFETIAQITRRQTARKASSIRCCTKPPNDFITACCWW